MKVEIPNCVSMEKVMAFADSCDCKVIRSQGGVALVPRSSNVVRIRNRPALNAVPNDSDKTLA